MKNDLLATGHRENTKGKMYPIQLAIIAALACLLATCYLPAVMEVDIISATYTTGNLLIIQFSPPMSDSGTFYIDEQLNTIFDKNTFSEIFNIGASSGGPLDTDVYEGYFTLDNINPPLTSPFTLYIHTDRWLYYDSTGDLFKTAAFKLRFITPSIAVNFY